MPRKVKTEPAARAPIDPDFMGAVGELFSVRLQRVEYLLNRAISEAWKDRSLRKGAIGILSQIVLCPGISPNEIAKRNLLDKSAVTLIVNNLEKQGWAERRKSETDGRRQSLHATEEGARELSRIVEQVKRIEAELLANVPREVLDRLLDALDQVHDFAWRQRL